MGLDHARATATISFSGLLLFRPVDKKCEVRVLKCHRHELSITIQQIFFEADGVTMRNSRIISHGLDLSQDIAISVTKPVAPGVEFWKDLSTEFNRKTGGSGEDIRWVLDFENNELNGNPVQFGPLTVANPKTFAPTIVIDHCKVYTELKTEDVLLARESIPDTNVRPFLGRAAFRIAADLECEPAAEIEVRNTLVDGSGVTLKQEDLTQYRITIENDCEFADDIESGSDFRFYYDALTTRDGQKFDLRRVVESDVPDPTVTDTPAGANFSSDNFPRLCLPASGGLR